MLFKNYVLLREAGEVAAPSMPSKEKLQSLLNTLNVRQIAAIYGVSPSKILQLMKDYKVKKSTSSEVKSDSDDDKTPPAPDKKEFSNYMKTQTIDQLAVMYNVTPNVIKKWMKKLDLKKGRKEKAVKIQKGKRVYKDMDELVKQIKSRATAESAKDIAAQELGEEAHDYAIKFLRRTFGKGREDVDYEDIANDLVAHLLQREQTASGKLGEYDKIMKIPMERPEGNVRRWIGSFLRSRTIDKFRKSKKEQEKLGSTGGDRKEELSNVPSREADFVDALMAHEETLKLSELIDKINNTEMKTVLKRVLIDGQENYNLIAQELKISEEYARQLFKRGKEALMRLLGITQEDIEFEKQKAIRRKEKRPETAIDQKFISTLGGQYPDVATPKEPEETSIWSGERRAGTSPSGREMLAGFSKLYGQQQPSDGESIYDLGNYKSKYKSSDDEKFEPFKISGSAEPPYDDSKHGSIPSPYDKHDPQIDVEDYLGHTKLSSIFRKQMRDAGIKNKEDYEEILKAIAAAEPDEPIEDYIRDFEKKNALSKATKAEIDAAAKEFRRRRSEQRKKPEPVKKMYYDPETKTTTFIGGRYLEPHDPFKWEPKKHDDSKSRTGYGPSMLRKIAARLIRQEKRGGMKALQAAKEFENEYLDDGSKSAFYSDLYSGLSDMVAKMQNPLGWRPAKERLKRQYYQEVPPYGTDGEELGMPRPITIGGSGEDVEPYIGGSLYRPSHIGPDKLKEIAAKLVRDERKSGANALKAAREMEKQLGAYVSGLSYEITKLQNSSLDKPVFNLRAVRSEDMFMQSAKRFFDDNYRLILSKLEHRFPQSLYPNLDNKSYAMEIAGMADAELMKHARDLERMHPQLRPSAPTGSNKPSGYYSFSKAVERVLEKERPTPESEKFGDRSDPAWLQNLAGIPLNFRGEPDLIKIAEKIMDQAGSEYNALKTSFNMERKIPKLTGLSHRLKKVMQDAGLWDKDLGEMLKAFDAEPKSKS